MLLADTMGSEKWTVDELMSSVRCQNCLHDRFNTWAPCIRQSSQINLHPEFVSRPRQIWYLVIKLLKYIKPADKPNCPYYSYDGEHRVEHESYHPQHLNRQIKANVPKYLQTVTIVRRGKLKVSKTA